MKIIFGRISVTNFKTKSLFLYEFRVLFMTRKKKSYGRGRGKREKKVFPQMTGKVQMTREGYIFVIAEGDEDDVFVKA